MKIESFDDGTKLMDRAKHRTEAEKIRASENPYRQAVAKCAYRQPLDSGDHLHDRKIFHFEDGSSLTFEVTYIAVEDGAS